MQNKSRYPIAVLALCMFMLVSLQLGLLAGAAQPDLAATAAMVLDVDTGEILYSKNETDPQSPGGLTKIMTALVVADRYDLSEKVAFSEILYAIEEGSSSFGLQPGEEITLYDALCTVMMGSANDVANGLAEFVAGSPAAFAELMNEKATELGCKNTHFTNPHGLYDEAQVTCAADLARIAQAAYENPELRQIFGMREYTIEATNLTDGMRSLVNDHQMMQNGSDCYQEWCVGGKASYTSQSQNTIVSFGDNGEKEVVGVVMGVEEPARAYRESSVIISYGFEGSAAQTEEKTTEKPADTTVPETSAQPQTELQQSAPQSEGPALPQTEAEPENVLELLKAYWKDGPDVLTAYAKNHFETVFICGCVFLIFMFVLIVLLFMRTITNHKIRRRRKEAEREWREKEAELRAMRREDDDDDPPGFLR